MTKIKAFITHKMKESFEDCQDSYKINKENGAIAVADGVSQSIFPKQWADLLTKKFVEDKDFSLTSESKIESARDEWWKFFEDELERQQKENSPMVWNLENCFKARKSAGATLVGIHISIAKKWSKREEYINYEVIGDSCLIVVKDNKVKEQISSKPEGAKFDNYPDYIDSNSNIGTKGVPKTGKIAMSDCDKLFLVTDALSDKFNEERTRPDKGNSFIERISAISNHDEFEKFIGSLRKEGLSNDDTTLVCIEWDKNKKIDIVYETPFKEYIEKERENAAKDNSLKEKNSSFIISENKIKTSDSHKSTNIEEMTESISQGIKELDNSAKYIESIIRLFAKHICGIYEKELSQNTKKKLISYIDMHKEAFAEKILKLLQDNEKTKN
jgi:hypothetical protein